MNAFRFLLRYAGNYVGVSAVLISMNWQLMLLSLIPIPLIVLAMRGFAKYVRPAFRKRPRELGELNATLNDDLSGIREQLLDRLHGVAYAGFDGSVDAHVKNLRRELETDPAEPHYVLTVYGIGYKFTDEV